MDIDNYSIPLSEIIARFPGHVFWKNREGVYLGCNSELALSIGLTCVEDLVGKTDFDIVEINEANRLRDIDLDVMETGKTHIVEEAVVLQGEDRVYISKKAPLKNASGETVGVIGTSVDITERKRAEGAMLIAMQKSEQANQAKNEFIANMSHDLRTPLSGLQALAENMQAATDDPELAHDAALMQSASGDLLRLIDSILDVVRADADVDIRVDHDFKLYPLVMNSINIIMPKIKEKQMAFKLNFDKHIPERVKGQALMLQRIIMNLLGNAVKFTDKAGGIKLSIKLVSKNASKCVVALAVEDSGIGIPEDKIDIIFDKFSRISESFRGQYKGTGVGLYMVKQYIDKMGGSISVKSGEGSGTTFICEIPFLISDIVGESMAEEAATQKLDKAQCELVGASILLVEDNVIAQHSQSTKFQSLGCSVDIAGNARVATELFKQKKFDLLVIDLGLPDLDGWSLARSFRSDRSNPNSLVPIVVLTAHADIDEVSAQYGNKLPSVVFRRKPLMLENARSLLHEYVA